MVIGGGWQGAGDRDTRETAILPASLIGNLRLACHAVPALGAARIARAWAGFEAETADALPAVGSLPGIADAFMIGAVHSGYTSGLHIAKCLAQTLLGVEPELGLAAFDPARLVTA